MAFEGGNLKFGTVPLQRKYQNSSVVFSVFSFPLHERKAAVLPDLQAHYAAEQIPPVHKVRKV